MPMPSKHTITWSAWRALDGILPLAPRVLAEILDGGQAFRWHRIHTHASLPNPVYQGTWGASLAQLTCDDAGRLMWRAPSARIGGELRRYLALDTDFEALARSLSRRAAGDPALRSAIAGFRGLRILRQPFGEALLGFICSATKQIPQIKQMLALLAERHGSEFLPGRRALPSWSELAALTEEQLRGCKLGFRARHIHRAAHYIAARGGGRWLRETENAPYPAAKTRLLELPGVGEKVADCVLLFGAGRLEAFPVDTWIQRALRENYARDLPEKMNGSRLAHFARERFGPAAGLAQQYLFAHARATASAQK